MTIQDQDKDLRSIQEARRLADRCRIAQRQFATASAKQVDTICEAMAEAAYRDAARLGKLAHDETGYGNADDKTIKNQLASKNVWESIRDTPTVGIVFRDQAKKMLEIAEPMGVVAALTPSTNPACTAIFKILIAVKGRNGIVISAHPAALHCTVEVVKIMAAAAERAGAPSGLIACLEEGHFAGTQELMRHHAVSVILATGGNAMVRAAHSVGKPAYGGGPGNVPVWVDRSADIAKAARDIVNSRSFDYGLLCASEQTVVADRPIADELRSHMEAEGAYWIDDESAVKLGRLLFNTDYSLNSKYIGRTAIALAAAVGLTVPANTRILVASINEIGPMEPLSREKLTTVLGFITAADAAQGLEYCVSVLKFGGDGHTAILHSSNREQVESMADRLPAFRIVVNSLGTLGVTGMTSGFTPTMTLGTGGIGGSITGDNISVEHLINHKRVGWELEPWGSAPLAGVTHANVAQPADGDIEAIVAEVLARLRQSPESRKLAI